MTRTIADGVNMARFRDKARQFLQAHEDHLALQRLRRGQALTRADLDELQRMLIEAGGTIELVEQAATQEQGLGCFIRSLVGMEREAVTQAFNEFLVGSTATPDQIEFIDHVIAELTSNGMMAPDRLYESPFLDISPQGPEALFEPKRVDRIFQILSEFQLRAAA